MLKLNTSMVFREKERKFKNIVSEMYLKLFYDIRKKKEIRSLRNSIYCYFQFELLFRRSVLGLAYKQTMIDKFENGTLKVFFRLYLDRRKISRSIINIEDIIKDIIVKETYSISSLFKDMEYLSGIVRNYRDSTAVGALVCRFKQTQTVYNCAIWIMLILAINRETHMSLVVLDKELTSS